MNIVSRQQAKIIELLGSMSQATGYSADWLTINNKNYSLGSFPRAEVYLKSERNISITSPINSANTQSISIEQTYEIKIAGKIQLPSTNPIFDINTPWNEALNDLKKVFSIHNTLDELCDNFAYYDCKPEYSAKDQWIVGKLITIWKSYYTHDRLNPELFSTP